MDNLKNISHLNELYTWARDTVMWQLSIGYHIHGCP